MIQQPFGEVNTRFYRPNNSLSTKDVVQDRSLGGGERNYSTHPLKSVPPIFHNLGKIQKKLISLHGSKHCSDNKRYIKKKGYITKPIDLFLCLSVLKIWYQLCKPLPGPFLKLPATPPCPVHTHLHYCTIQYICSFKWSINPWIG